MYPRFSIGFVLGVFLESAAFLQLGISWTNREDLCTSRFSVCDFTSRLEDGDPGRSLLTFKGQGVNFLITEIDKSDPLAYEGHRGHTRSSSSKRLVKSHTLN